MCLIVLFILSMALMIFSPNLISILLGRDGLSLVSYCLVIYYQNNKSFNAGLITLFTNRVGDVALLMAVVWMVNFGSWNLIYFFYFKSNTLVMNLIVLLVVLACMTKSAQIHFPAWLPTSCHGYSDACIISSSFINFSTAGVYLMLRFFDDLF